MGLLVDASSLVKSSSSSDSGNAVDNDVDESLPHISIDHHHLQASQNIPRDSA